MPSDSVLMKLAAERRKKRAQGAGAPKRRRARKKKAPIKPWLAGFLKHANREALEYAANRNEAKNETPEQRAFVRAARAKLARMTRKKGSQAKALRRPKPHKRPHESPRAAIRGGATAGRRARVLAEHGATRVPPPRKGKGLRGLPDAFLRRIAQAQGPKAPAARAELARRSHRR